MAYYVDYNAVLLDEAYKLAQIRSKESDKKAADDLYAVDEVLAGRGGVISACGLDERLRKEYKTIEQLENKEIKYAYEVANVASPACSETERMVQRLKSDRRGILADVLIKHGKMKFAEELYKKWTGKIAHIV